MSRLPLTELQCTSTLPWASSLQAYPADFGLASLYDCMSQTPSQENENASHRPGENIFKRHVR